MKSISSAVGLVANALNVWPIMKKRHDDDRSSKLTLDLNLAMDQEPLIKSTTWNLIFVADETAINQSHMRYTQLQDIICSVNTGSFLQSKCCGRFSWKISTCFITKFNLNRFILQLNKSKTFTTTRSAWKVIIKSVWEI